MSYILKIEKSKDYGLPEEQHIESTYLPRVSDKITLFDTGRDAYNGTSCKLELSVLKVEHRIFSVKERKQKQDGFPVVTAKVIEKK